MLYLQINNSMQSSKWYENKQSAMNEGGYMYPYDWKTSLDQSERRLDASNNAQQVRTRSLLQQYNSNQRLESVRNAASQFRNSLTGAIDNLQTIETLNAAQQASINRSASSITRTTTAMAKGDTPAMPTSNSQPPLQNRADCKPFLVEDSELFRLKGDLDAAEQSLADAQQPIDLSKQAYIDWVTEQNYNWAMHGEISSKQSILSYEEWARSLQEQQSKLIKYASEKLELKRKAYEESKQDAQAASMDYKKAFNREARIHRGAYRPFDEGSSMDNFLSPLEFRLERNRLYYEHALLSNSAHPQMQNAIKLLKGDQIVDQAAWNDKDYFRRNPLPRDLDLGCETILVDSLRLLKETTDNIYIIGQARELIDKSHSWIKIVEIYKPEIGAAIGKALEVTDYYLQYKDFMQKPILGERLATVNSLANYCQAVISRQVGTDVGYFRKRIVEVNSAIEEFVKTPGTDEVLQEYCRTLIDNNLTLLQREEKELAAYQKKATKLKPT